MFEQACPAAPDGATCAICDTDVAGTAALRLVSACYVQKGSRRKHLARGDWVCLHRRRRQELDETCCVSRYGVWCAETQCACLAGPGSHADTVSGPVRLYPSSCGWVCRAHCQAQMALGFAAQPSLRDHPSWPEEGAARRLTGGIDHVATTGVEGRPHFLEVLLEKRRAELRKDGLLDFPGSTDGPDTGDPILAVMHRERSLAEDDATSQIIDGGLDRLAGALHRWNPSMHKADMAGHLWVAAATMCRMLGQDFCSQASSAFAQRPVLLESASELSATVERVAKAVFRKGGSVISSAFMPHSVAASTVNKYRGRTQKLKMVMRHWDAHRDAPDGVITYVDWSMVVAMAPAIGRQLAGDGRGHAGSMAGAADLCQLLRGFGGTLFLAAKPLRDTARAIVRAGAPKQTDWLTWSPAGPGARVTLETRYTTAWTTAVFGACTRLAANESVCARRSVAIFSTCLSTRLMRSPTMSSRN